jgi:hypothetical protein
VARSLHSSATENSNRLGCRVNALAESPAEQSGWPGTLRCAITCSSSSLLLYLPDVHRPTAIPIPAARRVRACRYFQRIQRSQRGFVFSKSSKLKITALRKQRLTVRSKGNLYDYEILTPMRKSSLIVSVVILSGCAGTSGHHKSPQEIADSEHVRRKHPLLQRMGLETPSTHKIELLPPVTVETRSRAESVPGEPQETAPFVRPGSLSVDPTVF